MKEIIKVLMERDGLSEEEATLFYNEVMEVVVEAVEEDDFITAEEVFMNEFGLELDYLIDAIETF